MILFIVRPDGSTHAAAGARGGKSMPTAVLIEGMQKVQEYGEKFVLANVQESVQHISEIARLGPGLPNFS